MDFAEKFRSAYPGTLILTITESYYPDFFIPAWNLWLVFSKSESRKFITTKQHKICKYLSDNGGKVTIFRSHDEALEFLPYYQVYGEVKLT